MDSLNLEILPLTDASPYNVIHGCAKLINRRQLFEPNRLRDENRSEEERVNTHATNIQKYLSQPGSTVYYARNKPSDEVVGWIGWLRPSLTSHFLPEANNQKEAIDSTVDKEKDMDAIKSVAGEKKSLEKKFFGDEPFW